MYRIYMYIMYVRVMYGSSQCCVKKYVCMYNDMNEWVDGYVSR